ncbi:MAG: ABC transporter ATP-binding protein/permease [Rhodospirillales bacterium]|nr:ABC transporter ATP-binding protein/permease [Rhodospirillales bacterium]
MTETKPPARNPARPRPERSWPTMALVFAALPMAEPAFRRRFVFTLALMTVAALLNALVPNLFAAAVDAFSGVNPWALTPVAILLAYVAGHWLAKMFNESRWMLYGPIEQRAQRRLALRASEHLLRLSLEFHQTRNTGEISRIMDNGLRGLREFLFNAFFLILPFSAEIFFVAVIMFTRLDPVFCLLLVATLGVYTVTLLIGSEHLRRHQRQAVTRGAIAHGEAIDALINYETVKHFGNEAFVASRYDGSLAEVEQLTVKAHTHRSLLGFALMTIVACGMASILLTAGGRIEAGTMTIGDLVLVNAYLLQLVRPLERLGNLYRTIKQALVELEQLARLLARQADLVDRPDARTLPPGPGAIAVEGLEFSYSDIGRAVHDLSFTAKPGQKIALVGPSGAGKSTIAKLLFRFYDPDAGTIRLDGHDIRGLTLESFRDAVAVVPQDPVLFNDTIGYNIAFGRPDANQAEIEAVAQLAQIHEFISGLPDGYATRVGERGLKLSGGEKQRVAIARAFLKRARLLVLDEATSALDSTTEKGVQDCLRQGASHVTTIVVAHRLSTIVDADLILVLDEGRVVERGTHAELVSAQGLYAELWQRQAQQTDKL